MPDGMSEDMPDMPEDMTDRVPEDMPEHIAEDMPGRMPEDMPDRMPEDMPDKMPEDMPDRMPEDMPDKMPEDMSDRMPEDLPVTERIDVMVGITQSKVIVEALTRKKTISKPQKFTTLHPNSRPQKARHPARHRAIILRRFQPTKRPLIQEATAIMATILMVLSSQWRGHNPGYDMKHMKHTKK